MGDCAVVCLAYVKTPLSPHSSPMYIVKAD